MSEHTIDFMMMSFRASSDPKEKRVIRRDIELATKDEIKRYEASKPVPESLNEWEDGAVCKAFPEVMFQEKGETWATRLAKTACGVCVVRGECLAQALSDKSVAPFGVWGSLDERERRRMLRAKKAA